MSVHTDKDGKDKVVAAPNGNASTVKNINDVLKEREKESKSKGEDKEMSLDSTERVKVLSPGQLVFKRFITNKLAILGSFILIAMFVFSFIAPFFYPYGQTEIFYKYDNSVIDYAQAVERNDFTAYYLVDENSVHYSVKNFLTASINSMKESGRDELDLQDNDGNSYTLRKNEDNIFTLFATDREQVATLGGNVEYGTYSIIGGGSFAAADGIEIPEGLEAAIKDAVAAKSTEFSFKGDTYTLKQVKKSYTVSKASDGYSYIGKALGSDFEAKADAAGNGDRFEMGGVTYVVEVVKDTKNVYKLAGETEAALLTTYVFDSYDSSKPVKDDFKVAAVRAKVDGTDFSVNGTDYTLSEDEGETVVYEAGDSKTPVCVFSNFVIRRYSGEDSLDFDFKEKVREVIDEMAGSNAKVSKFTWNIAQVDENGEYTYDENGELIKEEREVTLTKKNNAYVMTVLQVVHLIDTFAPPSREHIAGTDGDGMDVFARMMYGGRVSLVFSFIVVIIETILGIIMGGIAGYYGKWVDNLIMRMVDVFYCIPSMPILIILGAMFDAMKLKPYVRVAWLMAVLGFLGWAGVARLVRGQILSLREQEFMVATEAVGLKTGRRIFKHLIPNVMPQLIVTATSGLGSVIITESTLSFLGLGVKHPLATWGTMINSVSTAEAMKLYTYIWVPVGLLICLTVIAFNFVGDGLRDAFDPKMKR